MSRPPFRPPQAKWAPSIAGGPMRERSRSRRSMPRPSQSVERRPHSRSQTGRIPTTPPGDPQPRMPRAAGASQPGVAFAHTPACSPLVDSLLTTCTDSVYNILREAHISAPEPRIPIRGTTNYGSFSQVVHKLKLAYAANLKNCVFQEADEVRGTQDLRADAQVDRRGWT